MTHKEAVPVVRRHLPIWERALGDFVFTSPEDSAMDQSDLKEVLIGKAEHHGELSARRIIKIFEYALSKKWEYFCLLEYDAIVLDFPKDVIPERGGVSAAKYVQNKPHKFTAKFYLHYPMLFTREGARKVLELLPSIGGNDRQFSDRFIGKAVQLGEIPVKNLIKLNLAWTKNTITEKHRIPLKKARKKGAVFFHGVKTEEILRIII
jgi:hypothetical protein